MWEREEAGGGEGRGPPPSFPSFPTLLPPLPHPLLSPLPPLPSPSSPLFLLSPLPCSLLSLLSPLPPLPSPLPSPSSPSSSLSLLPPLPCSLLSPAPSSPLVIDVCVYMLGCGLEFHCWCGLSELFLWEWQ